MLAEGDDGDVLDNLVNAVIGESIEALHGTPPADWDEWFLRFRKVLIEEIDHVMQGMHPDVVRALLRESLGRSAWTRSEDLIQEAFPHLKARREKVEEFVAAVKQGGVLLLGKDTGEGLALLKRIADALERRGRAPILLKEQRDHEHLGLIAKLLINTSAARWVLIENSYPSGHLYELPFLDMAGVVAAVLQQEGLGASSMPDEAMLKNAQWRRFRYEPSGLEAAVTTAMEWAEASVTAMQKLHRSARPWRDFPEQDRS